MKILLVCAGSTLGYKVLRCAAAGGHEVYVMGDRRSIEQGSRQLNRFARRFFGAPTADDAIHQARQNGPSGFVAAPAQSRVKNPAVVSAGI